MSDMPEHDGDHLSRADVDLIWRMRASRVVPALRNFAALRFIRLPLNRGVDRVIEEPLRGVVNELDLIVDNDPAITAAVLEVWNLVDDRDFWSAVGKRLRKPSAVS